MHLEIYLMLTERAVLSHGFAHQLHGSVMTLGSLPSPARWVIGASLPVVLYGARSTTFSLAEGWHSSLRSGPPDVRPCSGDAAAHSVACCRRGAFGVGTAGHSLCICVLKPSYLILLVDAPQLPSWQSPAGSISSHQHIHSWSHRRRRSGLSSCQRVGRRCSRSAAPTRPTPTPPSPSASRCGSPHRQAVSYIETASLEGNWL